MKCPQKTESRVVVAGGWVWDLGLAALGHEGARWDDGNVLNVDCGG